MLNQPHVMHPRRARFRGAGWLALALAIAALMVVPLVSLVWLAATPSAPIWGHLWSTALPRYVGNTVALMAVVGVASGVLGTGLAFAVTHIHFPGRRWLQYALFLPLAMPAYIAAFAVVDFFEYAGALQTALRNVFGWTSPADYWFPQVRSFGGAALVFTLTLYPYVYLLARSAFRTQSSRVRDMARSLGLGPWGAFWRVSLPLARPGIVAGMAIVMMEVLSDFGAVEFFAVQTLTTGIFSVWLQSYNAGGAAQLSLCLLAFVLILVMLERFQRAGARYNKSARHTATVALQRPRLWVGWVTTAVALAVLGAGFGVPAALLLGHGAQVGFAMTADGLSAFATSALLGALAAVVCCTLGGLLVYGARQNGGRGMALLVRIATLGYAVPGAVLGIALLIPMAAFDNALADAITAATGRDPGLLLTGGLGLLLVAFTIRFMAIAVGAAETGLAGVAPSVLLAGRTLGLGQGKVIVRVLAPLMRTSLVSAMLLVFVDTVKELPATLLLRPFGVETLATYTYAQATLENLALASVPALLIVALSSLAVVFLARTKD